jgi:hypothetical protein
MRKNRPSCVVQHTPRTHRRKEFCLDIRKSFLLFAACGSLDGRTCSTQPAPGSFRGFTSFQTCSRGSPSFADGYFASPRKPFAFPFHHMNRAASAKSLLRRIGLRCDSSQGRPDRLCQTRQKCRIFGMASCACLHKLAPFNLWMPCRAEQGVVRHSYASSFGVALKIMTFWPGCTRCRLHQSRRAPGLLPYPQLFALAASYLCWCCELD